MNSANSPGLILKDLKVKFDVNEKNGKYEYMIKGSEDPYVVTSDFNQVILDLTSKYEMFVKGCNSVFKKHVKYDIMTGRILKNEDGTIGTVTPGYCKSRMCTNDYCIKYRTREVVKSIKPLYEKTRTICSVTLTLPNIRYDEWDLSMKKRLDKLFNDWRREVDQKQVLSMKSFRRVKKQLNRPVIYVKQLHFKPWKKELHVHWHLNYMGKYPTREKMLSVWRKLVREFMGSDKYDQFLERMKNQGNDTKPGFVFTSYNFKGRNGQLLTRKQAEKKKYKMMWYMAERAATEGLIRYNKGGTGHIAMDTIDFLLYVHGSKVINRSGKFDQETVAYFINIANILKKDREKTGIITLSDAPNLKREREPPDSIYDDIKKELEEDNRFTLYDDEEWYLTIMLK